MRHIAVLLLASGAVTAWAQQDSGAAAFTAPFTAEERWKHYVHRTYSWQRMTLLAADTAVDHAFNDPRQWGRAPDTYFYRYASAFGRRIVRNSIELGAGMALHEDTRFRPSGETGLLNRLRFATTNTVMARGPDGNRRFAWSRLLATTGGVLVSSTWHPHRPHHEHNYVSCVANGYFGHLHNSLLTEFGPDAMAFGKTIRRKILGR
jgi:hypothetical protein